MLTIKETPSDYTLSSTPTPVCSRPSSSKTAGVKGTDSKGKKEEEESEEDDSWKGIRKKISFKNGVAIVERNTQLEQRMYFFFG
jgi:hypothetical protein